MSFDLRDYIVVFENIVPDELCDEIINEFKNAESLQQAKIASGLDKNFRNCYSLNISNQNVLNFNPDVRLKIDKKLFEASGKVLQLYLSKFKNFSATSDFGYVFLRYDIGGFYLQHTDSYIDSPRSLSCSFCLNDDYDGGDWGFFDRNLTFKSKKGSAIVFPSNFLYPHEIMPVTNGTRYSIITWFL